MEIDRQHRALILIAAGTILLFALLYALSGGPGSVTSQDVARKPLVAKAGTSRENSFVFDRANDDMELDVSNPGGGSGTGDSDDSEATAGDDNRPAAPSSPEEQAIQEAFNAIDPRTGIERLKAHLASIRSAAEAAQTYTALATLQLQTDPPNFDEALSSAALARNSATSDADAHAAGLVEARVRAEQGDLAGAAEGIERLIEERPLVTVPGLELRVMLGHIAVRQKDHKKARSCYEQAAEEAIQNAATLGEPALDIYRQACAHLSRSYAFRGDTAQAKAVVREMSRRLQTVQ